MFREMRRKSQQLTRQECQSVLQRGTSGVLALLGQDGYPYAVPISYAYEGDRLLFHGAARGQKIDAIKSWKKASFCVVDQDRVVPEEYTTYFRSVIVFGTIRLLEEETEKRRAIELLAARYYPDGSPEFQRQAIHREWTALCMMELSIEQMTGKEAIELVRLRRSGIPDGPLKED